MLNQLKHITQPRTAFGIEISFSKEGVKYYSTQLKRTGNEVELISSKEYVSKEELLQNIPENTLLGIHFSGKGIITKPCNDTEINKAIQAVLPNANPNDFYHQFTTAEKQTYLSIVRKESIDELILLFQKQFVTTIELDLPSIESTFSILDKSTEKETLQIGEQVLQKEYYPSFSVAFKTLLNIEESTTSFLASTFNKSEHTQSQIFKVASITALATCLCVLLINFFLLNHYNEQNQQLSFEANQYELLNSERETLKTTLKQREKFIAESGWSNGRFISKQADEIASCMPKELLLSELSFTPIDLFETRKQKRTCFKANTIFASGKTNNPTALNTWINDLKKIESIKNVEIKSYVYDSRLRVGNFELTLFN